MCFPGASIAVGVLGAVVSMASAAASYQAAEEDYQNRAIEWRQNYTNAVASKRAEEDQLNLRMIEEEEAYIQRRHQASVEGAEATASATLSAAQSGLSGISVDNIKIGIARKVADNLSAEKTSYRSTVAQLGQEVKSVEARTKSRINSVQIPNKPNPLGFMLQGIGGAIGAFG